MTENKPENAAPRRRYSVFPKSLGASLAPFIKPIYKKQGFAEHRILSEWPAIVGEPWASCCVPRKLTGRRGESGTLQVLVAPGRALELQHMQPQILERINGYFGYAAVSRLSFKQAPGPLFAPKPIAAALHYEAPDATLLRQVAACEDEELRLRLLSLGQAIAAREA